MEIFCHTRLPSLNYAGGNVPHSVITYTLTVVQQGPYSGTETS